MSEETKPPEESEGTSETVLDQRSRAEIKENIIEALKTIFDPEIPIDIYELGLFYEIDVDEKGVAAIQMTLTSPACPVAGSLPPEVEQKVAALEGVTRASVELVWDPPWTPDLMTEAARLQLNLF
ncbi:MAG: SUF system Fe-S cluster assembly protein [Deltaproteobacteria bacterium]|nr:SUF system Fe-S cluster assembly protein [Deltaproteobacteria bacterium]